jgi:hypothetical protein
MINGFEEQTEELSEYELKELLPILLKYLPRKLGKANAITGAAIRKGIEVNRGHVISGARLRKLINHIRKNDLIPCLIASSKGYYVATDNTDVSRFIESLNQRETAIRNVRLSMQRQLEHRANVKFQFPKNE